MDSMLSECAGRHRLVLMIVNNVILVVILLVVKCDSRRHCTYPSCLAAGRVYGRALDRAYDPCKDFYSFVCAKTLKRDKLFNQKFSDAVHIGTAENMHNALRVLALQRLQQIKQEYLNSTTAGQLLEWELQMMRFYDSCLDSELKPDVAATVTHLRELFHELGLDFFDEPPTRRTTASSVFLRLTQRYAFHDISSLAFDTEGDYLNIYCWRFYANETSWTHSHVRQAESLRKQYLAILDEKIANVTKEPNEGVMFGVRAALLSMPVSIPENIIRKMAINFEIIRRFKASFPGTDGTYQVMPLYDLVSRSGFPFLDWLNSNQDNVIHFKREHIIRVHYPSVIAMLNVVNNQKYTQYFKDYVAMQLLHYHAWALGGDMTRAICAFHPAACRIDVPLDEFCLRKTTEMFSRSYNALVGRVFHTERTIADMRYFVSLAKIHYAYYLDNLNMTVDRRTLARVLKAMTHLIPRVGYPQYMNEPNSYEHSVTLTENLFKNVLILTQEERYRQLVHFGLPKDPRIPIYDLTEFMYSSITNSVYFPSIWLAFPFFTEGVPDWVNMASMMTIIAHELTHLVTTIAINQPDKEADMSKDFYEGFKKRAFKYVHYPHNAACFSRKFDSPPWRESEAFAGDHVVDEAMADYMGLGIAYRAVQQIWKAEEVEYLPGFGGRYTKEQMFFVIAAFRTCTAKNFFGIGPHDVHPPWAYRINKGFANFAPFAEAFKCEPKTPMVASRLCRVFIREYMIPNYSPELADTEIE